jgi:molybdopterin-guanine dinucleotide biosynthesis protein A
MSAIARGDVTAAILAGGAARRFGGIDKGFVELDGRPLVAWSVDALAPQVAAILIVANRNAERYADYGCVIADRADGYRGPLEGVRSALVAATTPWLVTVPVDSPRPGADLVARLAAVVDEATDIVTCANGAQREPLFALYRVAALRDAPAPPDDLPVWRWHDALGARIVDLADTAARFANLNTPDELARYTLSR